MKRTALYFVISFSIICCRDRDAPDVTNIDVKVNTLRFEKDFFAMDTSHLVESLQHLEKKYPGFINDFTANILGLDMPALFRTDTPQLRAIKIFIKDYRPLLDSAENIFGDFDTQSKGIIKALQYVKYYFPQYKTPENIITFIGPMDAFFETSFGTGGDIITKEGLGVGIQLHLGSNFSYYKSAPAQELYPDYISRTFAPEYIVVNCVQNIIDDIYEDKSPGKPLIEQMVEKGKRLYLLDKILPGTPGYLKMAYSKMQFENASKNEAVIWNFFLANNLLNNQEQNITKNYIGESPKTPELGEDAPGNIGSFIGWQIIKKYMAKNPGISPGKMLNTDAREIYTAAKYRPKT